MHLSSTFSYDSHNSWMWNGGFDVEALLIHTLDMANENLSTDDEMINRNLVIRIPLAFCCFLSQYTSGSREQKSPTDAFLSADHLCHRLSGKRRATAARSEKQRMLSCEGWVGGCVLPINTLFNREYSCRSSHNFASFRFVLTQRRCQKHKFLSPLYQTEQNRE
jgi:hypothetical protein